MSALDTIEAAIRFLFDILKITAPGVAQISNIEPAVLDGIVLGDDVITDMRALMATPEWSDLVSRVKPIFETAGGTVTLAAGSKTTIQTYVPPPAVAGGHPSGTDSGRMPPGV